MKDSTRALKEIEELEKAYNANPEFFAEETQRRNLENLKESLHMAADSIFELVSAAAKKQPKVIKEVDEIFTPETLSKKLGVTKNALSAWRNIGKGPSFFKDGHKVFYTSQSVKEWIASKPKLKSTAEFFAEN